MDATNISWPASLVPDLNFHDLLAKFTHSLQTSINDVMHELMRWVLVTPMVGSDEITQRAWSIVQVISFSLIALILMYEGFKRVATVEGVGREVDIKQLLTRLIYAVMLSLFSLNVVNIFIGLNNALVATIAHNFPLQHIAEHVGGGTQQVLLLMVLSVVQLVIAIRLIIFYWMRQARIYLLAILAPLVYVLGIRPTTNRVGAWLNDLGTTVFSQSIHAFILALYSMLVNSAASRGTVSDSLLSIAMLLMMLQAPPMLRQYMGNEVNPVTAIRGYTRAVQSRWRTAKRATSRVGGWFKKS